MLRWKWGQKLVAVGVLVVMLLLPLVGLAKPLYPLEPETLFEFLKGSYRYQEDGWWFLHIEGEPFARGFQYGFYMGPEIEQSIALLKDYYAQDNQPWQLYRSIAEKMIWNKVPHEYQRQLEGIVAGVQTRGYEVDIWDITASNARYDISYYLGYLKNNKLPIPQEFGDYTVATPGIYAAIDSFLAKQAESCSAFAATGAATLTGEMILGHNTWTNYALAKLGENIIVHETPTSGHEILYQPYVGGIWSGRDWLMSGAGLVVAETTNPGMSSWYDVNGIPVFVRSRQATQYADNIDEWVKIMVEKNNGAYSNHWLVGDAKNNEIAALDLGLKKYDVQRTKSGFIGSCNFPQTEAIRSETTYDYTKPEGSYWRFERWNQLKKQYYGKITVELGKEFLADHYDAMKKEYGPDVRRTLCGHGELGGGTSGAVDGKVTSASLAKEMKFWARFGHPCGTPISSTEYFAQYPDKNAWLKPWNFSMPAQEWTVLGPRKEPKALKNK